MRRELDAAQRNAEHHNSSSSSNSSSSLHANPNNGMHDGAHSASARIEALEVQLRAAKGQLIETREQLVQVHIRFGCGGYVICVSVLC
jgi:hypothetical protein